MLKDTLFRRNVRDKEIIFLLYLILLSPLIYKPLSIMGLNVFSGLIVLLVTSVLYLFSIFHIFKNPEDLKSGSVYSFWCVMILISAHLILDFDISFRFIFLFYVIALYYVISRYEISNELLLKITNYTYLIYLLLSFLVYFSIVKYPGLSLNSFDYNIFNIFTYKTFIGFYGSTANLDSYSLLIALLNLVLNKGSKKNYVIIGLLISLGTLRFTPFVSLTIAAMFVIFVFIFSDAYSRINSLKHKVLIPIIASFIFALFIMISFISTSFNLIDLLGSITSGRNKIWVEMLRVYINEGKTIYQMIGYGSTEMFSIKPFGYFSETTINPHNNYLKILLEYGLFILIVFFVFVAKKLSEMNRISYLLIFFYILIVANTNSEIFDYIAPVYLLWFFQLINQRDKNIY